MEPLGSFLPAINALLQFRDWVSILKNLTGILELVLHITGYRYSRVGIDTHLGYRYSIGVSVLKNHSGIMECFKNVPGYRYSYEGIGTLCKNCIPTYVFYKGYRYPKAGIDTQMPGRQF
ncbi:hypothetical protein V6N11_056064 [Hibiscus sabdariffa]|uniref:Uncharacterized protein n=1 Tax=Hibiscus sabdariffa TaxID=183260 RepID=A0ABR2T392_9ROSI